MFGPSIRETRSTCYIWYSEAACASFGMIIRQPHKSVAFKGAASVWQVSVLSFVRVIMIKPSDRAVLQGQAEDFLTDGLRS